MLSVKIDFLPPEINKIETLPVLKQLSLSAAALGELKGIAKTIPNQSILVNAVVIQEAKDSSEIENIITTQDELYKALNSKIVQNNPTKEVINYRKAIFQGFEIIKKQGFLKLGDIVSIQETIVENTAGIRSVSGTVLKNDKTGEVVFTPPQDKDEILKLLGNFLEHFNLKLTQISPLIFLSILHHQFESIHPFYDGNGRTGRILNILNLQLNDLLDLPILYLSSYINKNKAQYYELLRHVNTTGEWESWIIYMLKGIEETANQTVNKVIEIKTLLEASIEKTKNEAPKIYKKELIELLFEQPYSKNEYLVERLGIERKAASKYLKQLEEIGLLRSQKVGKEMIYINVKLVEILKV
jgi:Fic family protein